MFLACAPVPSGTQTCSPSAQVGQFLAIVEERIFGSSLTAEGAGDESENRYAVGRGGEGGTRHKAGSFDEIEKAPLSTAKESANRTADGGVRPGSAAGSDVLHLSSKICDRGLLRPPPSWRWSAIAFSYSFECPSALGGCARRWPSTHPVRSRCRCGTGIEAQREAPALKL
jgi:hypothetical protein